MNLKEESFFDLLDNQYKEVDNKDQIDYWVPLSNLILESMEIRDSKNISQADLALKMKTKQSVISRFENMGRTPNYDFIARLSIALDHKPGMTLYGDYMAIIPIEHQEYIKKLADSENMEISKYVQKLLDDSIRVKKIKDNHTNILHTTSESVIKENTSNYQMADNSVLTPNNKDNNFVKMPLILSSN